MKPTQEYGPWMFSNPILHKSFFDSARCAMWEAIEELEERLSSLHNTQKDLKETEEEFEALQKEIE